MGLFGMDGSLGLGMFSPLTLLTLCLLSPSIEPDIVMEELINRRDGFQ